MSRRLLPAAIALAAGAALLATALPATAAPTAAASTFNVSYDANGTTTIVKPDSVVTLGPAVLSTMLKPNGVFSGSLALPPTTSTFKIVGLLPVNATVTFVAAGPLTGRLATVGKRTTVVSTSSYYVKLSDVTVAGLPAFVGDSCQTSDPVVIKVKTPAKQSFSVINGGVVAGTYTLGQFANCGLTTGLVNMLVPGDGNTISLTLSNGRQTG